MKQDIHPKYRNVLFVDSTSGKKFICGSTIPTKETATFEGAEYPVYQLSTSSYSHPFFTGSRQFVDQEGRIDKFQKRYAAAQKQREATAEQSKTVKSPKKKK